MTALPVAMFEIGDSETFAEYAQKASATFEPHGRALIARGLFQETLVGEGRA